MSSAWLILARPDDSAPGARYDLKAGLTMLGGVRGDIPVPDSASDCVHLWSEPPKLIFVGAGEPPQVNGQPAMEMSLHSGDRIAWHGFAATFGYEDGQARLEELPAERPAPVAAVREPARVNPIAVAAPAGRAAAGDYGSVPSAGGPVLWRWLKAGLLAEMALGDRALIKRWQDAVTRDEFDVEAATRELLASAPGLADDDPKLTERAKRLTRDLLMSSVTRSPMRQVRKAARNGVAFLLVQTMILVLFTLLVLAGMLLVHTRFGHSIDAFLDAVVDFF